MDFSNFSYKFQKKYTFLKNKYKTLYTKNIIVTLGYENVLTNTLETNN